MTLLVEDRLRLKNARVEFPSMPSRLTRDGSSEIARNMISSSAPFSRILPEVGNFQAKPLLADAEFGNDRLVALGIVFLEVVEQATPLADQHEKSAA